MSENVADERLTRALTAFLRQEVQAPAIAVTDFLDMIIEDARTAQPESMLADLNRMRSASVQLNAFVKSLIQDFIRRPADQRNAGSVSSPLASRPAQPAECNQRL